MLAGDEKKTRSLAAANISRSAFVSKNLARSTVEMPSSMPLDIGSGSSENFCVT